MITRIHCFAVAVGLAGVLLTGCGGDSDNETTAADLNGSTFTSTEVDGHDLVEGSKITLTFDDDKLSAEAGCNTMSAPYVIEDDLMSWDGEVAATMMACSDELTAQDAWLTDLLKTGVDVELDGDTLTLTHEDETIELAKS
ncbi:META domain-containing protein [Nocardioides sp. MAH-18]|uniref:META domain-containing protein n=1 Tax=Nocardioides agri TaxID=2682843 RepID=A0A6L6XXH5_9ACTN|nr:MULTISPECIES: META domain-containing protein [unclassified Nocardioides]MBA2952218.1 META domain-containing protein [Nocardioides sp. CGMCC 1.13656]MVQ51383.1 META domain-containing protein [Nocardioides sp. MAH-18]